MRYGLDASALSLLASVALAVLCGALVGATVTAYGMRQPGPIMIVEDAEVDIPVVHIEGIIDGGLRGTVAGEVRITAGGKMVPVDGSGAFAILERSVLTNRILVRAPPGMQFVASSKGKKYYPVGSGAGQNIVPQNRVYFPTAAAAETAGYVR